MYIYYATIQCKLFLTRGHSQKILKATGLEVEAERLTKEEPATESQPGLLRIKRYKGARESLRRQKLGKNKKKGVLLLPKSRAHHNVLSSSASPQQYCPEHWPTSFYPPDWELLSPSNFH